MLSLAAIASRVMPCRIVLAFFSNEECTAFRKTETMCKYVAYYRVSTAKQGASGLGLEAQEVAVAQFLNGRAADKLVGAYTEVESGKRNDRPELAKAMEHARLTGATLLIAKLDRLSRNAAFLLNLRETGVAFVACDNPEANRLTVGILALVAEQEREAISVRTKDALRAAKARGQVLGNPKGAAAFGERRGAGAAEARIAKADKRAKGLRDTIASIEAEGIVSANGIARRLNERGIATPREGKWSARSVLNVQGRLRIVAWACREGHRQAARRAACHRNGEWRG
jgi:DNA invertase Pin-like site-specific DNA recombinase